MLNLPMAPNMAFYQSIPIFRPSPVKLTPSILASNPITSMILRNRQNGLSDKEKLVQATQTALAFFQKYKDNPEGLLRILQSMGLEVYQGDTLPWVNSYLKIIGGTGAFLQPQSLISPSSHYESTTAKVLSSLGPDIPLNSDEIQLSLQLAHFVDHLKSSRHVTLLIRKGAMNVHNYDVVYHELFHFFQALYGLPWNSEDVKTAEQATKVIQQFYRGMNNPLKMVGMQLFCWGLRIKNFLMPTFPLTGSIGEAAQMIPERELETMHLMLSQGKALGVPWLERFKNHLRLSVYKNEKAYVSRWNDKFVETQGA